MFSTHVSLKPHSLQTFDADVVLSGSSVPLVISAHFSVNYLPSEALFQSMVCVTVLFTTVLHTVLDSVFLFSANSSPCSFAAVHVIYSECCS